MRLLSFKKILYLLLVFVPVAFLGDLLGLFGPVLIFILLPWV